MNWQNLGGGKIPFKIRRLFYSYASEEGIVRGAHANRISEFVLISVLGTLKVKVDDGKRTDVYNLDSPSKGVYIPQMIWKEMYDFSEDNVLLVVSNRHYDNTEYIRDYEEYRQKIAESDKEIRKQDNKPISCCLYK